MIAALFRSARGRAGLSALALVAGVLWVGFGSRSSDGGVADAAETAAPTRLAQAAPRRIAQAPGNHPFPRRQPAPSLDGGTDWINTAGPLDLKNLRGKFVLLDFWTYCCINCIHILPELKKLEKAYPNELVVIGVHSAKFETERDSKNIREAVLRYEIEHPVVNDARHIIWTKYGVTSWPSLRVIDPQGNLVATHSGEVRFEVLDGFLKNALPFYRNRKLLDTTPLHFDLEASKAERTPLRFPGKVLADEASNRLYIADSNHNRIVVTDLAGQLIDTIGSGAIGSADGGYAECSFDHLQGMALRDGTLYVADTENHMLRKVDLAAKRVTTIAGTGTQAAGYTIRRAGQPLAAELNSPWALWIHQSDLYIAMAGPHQIWKMPLDGSTIGPYAGNVKEDIVDGPLLPRELGEEGYSSFAQPSGLASDGTWLYVADSEGSSIRAVPFVPGGEVKTVIGTAHLPQGRLFAFGDRDGRNGTALLQHVLGVTYYNGLLYIADTYNNKIKVIDPGKQVCQSLVGTGQAGKDDNPPQFDEPAGISAAAGKLYVADTNNHAIRVIDLVNGNQVSTLEIVGLTPPAPPEPAEAAEDLFAGAVEVVVDPASVQPVDGQIQLRAQIALPVGWKMNDLAPQRYQVKLDGDAGPVDRQAAGRVVVRDEPAADFQISLPVTAVQGQDTVQVALEYYYCQIGAEGLCKVGTVAWTVPLTLGSGAASSEVALTHQVQ